MSEPNPSNEEIDKVLTRLDPSRVIQAELTIDFERIECANCTLSFYVPSRWIKARKELHDTFRCPNGCKQWFPKVEEK